MPSEKTVNLLSWHPRKSIIAVGWKISGISIFDVHNNNSRHIENTACSITSIVWSPCGFILLGAAENGHLSLWVFMDSTLNPQRLFLTSVESSISSAELLRTDCSRYVCAPRDVHEEIRIRNDSILPQIIDSAVFLCGCRDGRVVRVAADVSMALGSIESNYEKMITLTKCDAPITKILVDQKHKILLVITEENTLIEYKLSHGDNGRTITEVLVLKLPSQMNDQSYFCWAGEMTLAMALGEHVVRLWDIAKSDNYTLMPDVDISPCHKREIRVQALNYSLKFKLLAVGLSNGQIAIWRRCFGERKCKVPTMDCERHSLYSMTGSLTPETGSIVLDPESHWQVQPVIDLIANHGDDHIHESGVNITMVALSWNPTDGSIATAYRSSKCDDLSDEKDIFQTFVLRQHRRCANLGGGGSAVVQISPQRLVVMSSNLKRLIKVGGLDLVKTSLTSSATTTSSIEPFEAVENELAIDGQLRAAFCTKEHVSTWNGQQLCVYRHDISEGISPFSTFACEFELIAMHEQFILTKEEHRLHVRNLQGTVKQLVNVTEDEGSIISTTICNGFLVCFTSSGYLQIYDLNRREAKPLCSPKLLTSILPPFQEMSLDDLHVPAQRRPTETPRIQVSSLSINRVASLVAMSVLVASTEAPVTSIFRDEQPQEQPDVWCPDPRLFIWHVETDKVQVVDFATGEFKSTGDHMTTVTIQDNNEPTSKGDSVYLGISQAASDFIRGRYPVKHYWDTTDPRLLAVEAAPLPSSQRQTSNNSTSTNSSTPTAETDSNGVCLNNNDDDAYSVEDNPREFSPTGIMPSKRPESQISNKSDSISRTVSRFKTMERTGHWNLVISFFVSPEKTGLNVQEFFHTSPHHVALMGVEVPYFYFTVGTDYAKALTAISQTNPSTSTDTAAVGKQTRDASECGGGGGGRVPRSSQVLLHHLSRRVMREFHGLEGADVSTREAILNFSFFLAQGEIDAAFKSMKLIRSTAVWQNMAKISVNTRRIDVGLVCLGKMGNAMGAAMVREMQKTETSVTAQTGELALQLGMTAEAERLFVECGRWDLVARLHRGLGHWEEAIQVAEKHDRVRLRNTSYAYALELKKQGHLDDAITHFINSNTHLVEVPRMLKDTPRVLREFVKMHPERELQRWWAQALEAEGFMEEAEVYYTLAKDYLSLVRIFCCLDREEAALALCNETDDRAACYHLARQMETKGNIDHAIHLLTRARAYSSAVRICKEHNRNEHLYSLAQLGTPEDMLEAARHLEKQSGFEEKSILLYQRAGQLNTAIKLAFETKQYEALSNITASLGDDAICDPELIRKCANFFMQNHQFERAVKLLANGKQWVEAIKLCGDYDVAITEELVEKLTPPVEGGGVDRSEILARIGYQCLAQGQYHLACKKLTQAGDRVAAMKALLRSGDTEKIIFFANVSKQRDTYVMAANYLQTLDTWRTEPEIVRYIVQFYTRGKALESLASFYEACAQAEIEEYQSYEKAMGALTEAYKAISRAAANAAVNAEDASLSINLRLQAIKAKIMFCKQFVETRLLFDEDPMEALSRCKSLLDEPQSSTVIRPGDIYATMVRELAAKSKFKAAYACLQDMREKLGGRETVSRFLDAPTQTKIFEALGMQHQPLPLMPSDISNDLERRGWRQFHGSDDDPASHPDVEESIEDNASDVGEDSDLDDEDGFLTAHN